MAHVRVKTIFEVLAIAVCATYLILCKPEIENAFTRPKPREWAPAAVARKQFKEDLDPKEEAGMKKILLWNDYNPNFMEGHEPFVKQGCRYTNCLFTRDRNRYPLRSIDALIWHVCASDRSFPDDSSRSPHTRYIIITHEAPFHIGDHRLLLRYNNLFNWTMHYMRESDISLPYGIVYPTGQRAIRPQEDVMSKKTRMAAWFVSDCRSRSGREELGKRLQEYMSIDIYGACGTMTCLPGSAECRTMLEKYFFYFAFENSLCQDYITEKLYYNLDYYVVPVVWGMGNYTASAPPHSVVNALDFPNVEALANYLNYLSNNHTAYYEYFLWKRNYRIRTLEQIKKTAMCEICERLHTDNTTKVYDNIFRWFAVERQCLLANHERVREFLDSGKENLVI